MSMTSDVLKGRIRAWLYRFGGLHIGSATRMGARIRIDRRGCVELGVRCEIEDDVWFKTPEEAARVRIGDYGFVGRGSEFDCVERIEVGAHVLIAPGTFITDHGHNIAPGMNIDAQGCSRAPVVIGNDVWLGVRSVILPGVHIGDGAVVGAGAVVTHDVPAGAIATGVPARVTGWRDRLKDGVA